MQIDVELDLGLGGQTRQNVNHEEHTGRSHKRVRFAAVRFEGAASVPARQPVVAESVITRQPTPMRALGRAFTISG